MTEIMETYNRIEKDLKWILAEIQKPDAWRVLDENGKKLDSLSWKLKHPESNTNLDAIKQAMTKLTAEYKIALDSAKVVFYLTDIFEKAETVIASYREESRSNGWYAL